MHREKNIDYLKGICILLNIITHYRWTQQERLMLGFPFTVDMAVPFFMMISGYVYAMSYDRKAIDSLDKAFMRSRLVEQYIRFTVPFLIAFCIECIIYMTVALMGNPIMSIKDYLMAALTGGWGPGSYYYPIMIQFILIYPFIFMLVRKYSSKALLTLFLVNVFWEIIKMPYEVTAGGYRLLVFRYIFLIGYGCYVFLNSGEKQKKIERRILYALIFSGGVAFVLCTRYFGCPTYIFEEWTGTCVIACLWILPIFKWITTKREWKMKIPLDVCGKASYEIFLTQMVWWNFVSTYAETFNNKLLVCAVSVVVCVLCGHLFYKFNMHITRGVKLIIQEKEDGSAVK